MKQEYNLELFADYFQFYLEDEGIKANTPDIWNKEQVSQLLAVYPGLIAIGTARNMDVPVRVEVRKERPVLEVEKWDKVNECSLKIESGKIVVMGCCDYYPDALRIPVEPAVYRVRIHYGGLTTLSEDGLEGEDKYEVILWKDSGEKPIEKLK